MRKSKISKNSILFPEGRCYQSSLEKVTINGKAVNKEKGIEMEVPCTITFTGPKLILNKLKQVF